MLLIVLDRIGVGDVGALGSSLGVTPAIDALAARGVLFQRAYACSPQSGPARAAILTGRWPNALGFEFSVPLSIERASPGAARRGIEPTTPTLGSLLHAAGYQTAFVGSWQMGVTDQQSPAAMGFDASCSYAHAVRTHAPRPGKDDAFSLRRNGTIDESFARLDDALTTCAIEFIESSSEKPWALVAAFPGASPPLAPMPEDLASTSALEGKRAVMAAALRGLDRSIGALVDAVDRTGQRDRTIFVLVGDGGGATTQGASNGTLHGDAGSCFEGGLRVPMILVDPGVVTAGTRASFAVTGADVVPTVLAAVGAPAMQGSDGIDLLPFLAPGATQPSSTAREIVWRAGSSGGQLFSGLKYVVTTDSAPKLYRIDADPDEATDVAESMVDGHNMMLERHETWIKAQPPCRWFEDGTLPASASAPPSLTLPDPSKRRPNADG